MKEAISGILAIIAVCGAIAWGGYVEHNYTLEDCEVVKVYQDKTVVEDQAGNLWEFISNDYTPAYVLTSKCIQTSLMELLPMTL